MDDAALETWVGRSETVRDLAASGPLQRLAGLLDHDGARWRPGEVPPLGHWLYFLPQASQSELGEDGHPRRGGLLPPVELPRRMWAGGRLKFERPIPLDRPIDRRSTVTDVKRKVGRSGEMVFVTVLHEILADGAVAISEEQDIVYRGEPPPAPPEVPRAEPPPASASATRRLSAGTVQLFRYSALTFNSHRIHYDRDYATGVEGYPGLVVHGPYIATLLMDHFLATRPQAQVTGFTFRAQRPLFDGTDFTLNLGETEDGFTLWAADAHERVAMLATVAAR